MTNRNTAYRTNNPAESYYYEAGTAPSPACANEYYVQVDDGVNFYNTTPLPEKVTADIYQFKNWGFTLPYPDSLPTWIRVEFQGFHTDVVGNGTPAFIVRVKKSDAAGISVTNNVGSYTTNLTKNADDNLYQVIANSTDDSTKLFGLTLTKAEVESSQFSLVAHFLGDAAQNGATAYCYVDILRARIEYSLRVAPAQNVSTTTLSNVGGGRILKVPAGAVTITGYAPTVAVSDPKLVAVPAGSATIAGYAPTVAVSDHKLVAVPAGSATITGYAPAVAVSDHKLVAVPAGAVVVSGLSPVVTVTDFKLIQVPVGTVTVTGYAPSATVAAPLAPVLSLVAATSITAKTIIPQVVINF